MHQLIADMLILVTKKNNECNNKYVVDIHTVDQLSQYICTY